MKRSIKKHLNVGYLVELRNGELRLVLPTLEGKALVNSKGESMHLSRYDDEGKYAYRQGDSKYDIMKIWSVASHGSFSLFTARNRNRVWERKEKKKMTIAEIEALLGYEIEIENASETRDKVYYIKNTINEWDTVVNGYYSSLEKAKKALKECCDWYRSNGTGQIYEIELNNVNANETLVYKV